MAWLDLAEMFGLGESGVPRNVLKITRLGEAGYGVRRYDGARAFTDKGTEPFPPSSFVYRLGNRLRSQKRRFPAV